jgi:Holliday junction resolvasome RuvABC endonuclease subunit
MTSLALDPGLRTGFARSDGTSGIIDLSSFDDHGRAAAYFHDWLDQELRDHPPVFVAIESHFTSRRRRDQHASLTEWLCGLAHMVAWSHDIPRCERSATEVRRWLTGNPKARDREVIPAVRIRGFAPSTPHAADAAALLCAVECRAPIF